jgi:hypothetical protein
MAGHADISKFSELAVKGLGANFKILQYESIFSAIALHL